MTAWETRTAILPAVQGNKASVWGDRPLSKVGIERVGRMSCVPQPASSPSRIMTATNGTGTRTKKKKKKKEEEITLKAWL
jgi:hypothetical protein